MCPECRAVIYIPREKAGQSITCPDCLSEFTVQFPADTSSLPGREESGAPDSLEIPESPSGPPEAVPRVAEVCDSALPAVAATDSDTAAIPGDSPGEDEDYEFDVECPLCGTRQNAVRAQIGAKLSCPDCFFVITVHEPPAKARRKPFETTVASDEEIRLSEPVDSSTMASRSREILDAAELEVPAVRAERGASRRGEEGDERSSDAERSESEMPLPHHPLTHRLLVPFSDPRVLIRCLGIGLACEIQLAATLNALVRVQGNPFDQFLSAFMFAFCLVFGGATLFVSSVYLLAVLQDTAIGRDAIESWPEGFFVDWIADGLFVVVPLSLSIMPGVLLAQLVLCVGATPELYTETVAVCGTLSAFVAFPFLMLSSMEAGSAFVPVSRRIRRSLLLLPRGWLKFYVLSGGMAVAGLAAAAFAFSARLVVSLAAMVLLAAILMLYFRLLGRLAWCCREAVAEAETEEVESPE